MPDNKNAPALRKRQQIENANKMMFIWVAVAAAVVSIAAVLSVSIFERISFRQEVIGEKNKTVSTLRENNEIAEELKTNVRVLNTNTALTDTARVEGSEPLSVILDALPSAANSSALGASLQQKLLQVDGVAIETLVVDPISGVEDSGEEASEETSDNTVTFRFTVSAPDEQEAKLKQLLRNLERSIRAINLTSVSIERQGEDKIVMNAEGEAYFQPPTTVELKEKSVRP